MCRERPSESVLRSFGVGPEVRPLPGGQGNSWLAGNLVLKLGGGPEHRWIGEVLEALNVEGIRLVSPVASRDGAPTVDGWAATRFEAGSVPDLSRPSSWAGVIEAGRAFHRAVARLPRPDFVDVRDDPWAIADRVAWGEHPLAIGI